MKKAEDKLASLYEEIEENKEDVKNLEAKLGELEVEATKVMEAYQESQVDIDISLAVAWFHISISNYIIDT